MKSLIYIATLSFLSGYVYVPVEDYVHEETQPLRGLNNWPPNPPELAGKDLVLIPNFRSFTSEYPARRASLRITSKIPRAIYFDKVVITNKVTLFALDVEIDQTIKVELPYFSTEYFSHCCLPLLDAENNAQFIDASEIELEIWYSIDNGLMMSDIFIIERVEPWQWVSPPV